MYDPIRKIWYGTTDWMKAVPVGVAGYTADAVENLLPAKPKAPAQPDAKPGAPIGGLLSIRHQRTR